MEEEYLFASGMHVLFFNVAVHVRYFEVCFFFQDTFQRCCSSNIIMFSMIRIYLK